MLASNRHLGEQGTRALDRRLRQLAQYFVWIGFDCPGSAHPAKKKEPQEITPLTFTELTQKSNLTADLRSTTTALSEVAKADSIRRGPLGLVNRNFHDSIYHLSLIAQP